MTKIRGDYKLFFISPYSSDSKEFEKNHPEVVKHIIGALQSNGSLRMLDDPRPEIGDEIIELFMGKHLEAHVKGNIFADYRLLNYKIIEDGVEIDFRQFFSKDLEKLVDQEKPVLVGKR
ncbi:MAG: hypothetical protein Q7R33_04595 [Nitrosarchaeum sp.]|nr:hypothetical protein [Nitrosarchaeum sp.]